MSSSSKLHPSLPAPVVHAGFSVSQSKSHLLAGVQDAYWSDDEGEDAECPLCLEEMDISDLNFKPCICGYQVCQFCWHHIKENLNGRCPACRRVYTDEAVQFKPIAKEDHKRLTQQKKQRERERKDLDALGRRQLANVRVVQRNVVYVVGIGPRFAKEELIPTLRSHEYFGQYGKISKILLVKRTPSGGGAPVVGLYITYHRREDAARAISAVDGTASPGGSREVMRASYGTTKYCMSFLRGAACSDHGCMNLHEWGDEKDCFTKEDLTTLKHTMKATESRSRAVVGGKKGDEADALPRAASWAHKGFTTSTHNLASVTNRALTTSNAARPTRRGGGFRQPRNPTSSHTGTNDSRPPGVRSQGDRKSGTGMTGATKTPSQASSSRPPTPAPALTSQGTATPADVKTLRQKKDPRGPPTPPPCRSPTSSVALESDLGSDSPDVAPTSPAARRPSTESAQSSEPSVLSAPSLPPGLPTIPPGRSVSAGVLPSSVPPRVGSDSPQTPILASATSYQMSTAAKALLDDVKARRDVVALNTAASPFPDLDRTLQTLRGVDGQYGGFSFNLDPKLAGDDVDNAEPLPDFDAEASTPFPGNYFDAFPGLKSPKPPSSPLIAPPGMSYPRDPSRSLYDPPTTTVEKQSTGGTNYTGSFNPFAEPSEDALTSLRSSPYSPLDDDSNRKVSRFGFARGRRGSTAASSPRVVSSPLSESQTSLYAPGEYVSPPAPPQWVPSTRQQYSEYGFPPPSSPLVQHTQPQVQQAYPQQHSRFQPFDSGVSEAQLREFIQSSRERSFTSLNNGLPDKQESQSQFPQQPFSDPAIMSASFASPVPSSDSGYVDPAAMENMSTSRYGPPPGLYLHGMMPSPAVSNAHTNSEGFGPGSSAHAVPSSPQSLPPTLSASDFPALVSTTDPRGSRREGQSPTEADSPVLDDKAQIKAERKAAKRAAAAEKAAEKQLAAQEKAAAKAAEKAKAAQEKLAEKERQAALKAQQENLQREKLAKEKAARDKALQEEKERLAKLEKEKAAKEVAARTEKGRAVHAKKTKQADGQKSSKRPDPAASAPSANDPIPTTPSEPSSQVPLLSKKPKKNKPISKPIRVPREETSIEDSLTVSSTSVPEISHVSIAKPSHHTSESSSSNSRAQSVDQFMSNDPTSVEELLEDINLQDPVMDLPNHVFFDIHKINPAAKMPLEYGPLVHALSALSVGGGSFANNMPSGSIDNAVSSFQQLLETLTQTISDLLRLLPRTTWDDSSSFDGVLRDMLKGDDFLDDGGEDGPGKDDEVAALTLALERRARWMEVQLSKLEELHRDINTAAVRAVLTFNDNGWDRHGFMPRVGNTLRRFDNIGMIDHNGVMRPMTVDELEKKLLVAKEAAVFAETEVREIMESMQAIKPLEVEM